MILSTLIEKDLTICDNDNTNEDSCTAICQKVRINGVETTNNSMWQIDGDYFIVTEDTMERARSKQDIYKN